MTSGSATDSNLILKQMIRELQISGKFPPSNLHGETANLHGSCIFAFSLFQIGMEDCGCNSRRQVATLLIMNLGYHQENQC